jgi:hypothetical protein
MKLESAIAVGRGFLDQTARKFLSTAREYEVSTLAGSEEVTIRIVAKRSPDFAKLVIDEALK